MGLPVIELIKRHVNCAGWKYDNDKSIISGNVDNLIANEEGFKSILNLLTQLDSNLVIANEFKRYAAFYAVKFYDTTNNDESKDNYLNSCYNIINAWLSIISKSEKDYSTQTYFYDFRTQDDLVHEENKKDDGRDVIEREVAILLFKNTGEKELYKLFTEEKLSFWVERLFLFFLRRYDLKDAGKLLISSNIKGIKKLSRWRKLLLPSRFIIGILVGYILTLTGKSLYDEVFNKLNYYGGFNRELYLFIVGSLVSGVCYIDVSKRSKASGINRFFVRTPLVFFLGMVYVFLLATIHIILINAINSSCAPIWHYWGDVIKYVTDNVSKLIALFSLAYLLGVVVQLSWQDRSLMDDL